MPRNSIRRDFVAVAAFTTVAVALRVAVTYNSGFWADEGSFLNAIKSPSWGIMLDFLKQNESHPPLFYVMMRGWGNMTSWDDTAIMVIPILLGSLIVPAIYTVGAQLVSARAATIAAGLSVISAPLIEHSAQLRPYGLLTLLATISTGAFVQVVMRSTRKFAFVFVISSALMLYTHHWGWMILVGQCASATVLVLQGKRREKLRRLLRVAVLVGLVLVCYVPWFPTLVYQAQHAGHGSLPIEGLSEYAGFFLFSGFRILETLFLGRLADRQMVAFTALAAAIALVVYINKVTNAEDRSAPRPAVTESDDARYAVRALLLVAGFALLAAVLVSPLNNLMQPRGIATVMPLLLLPAGYAIEGILFRNFKSAQAQLLSVFLAFGIVASTLEIPPLLVTKRSNVSEISQLVQSNMKSTDLLVVAPEWFAASFDHYFPRSIEQIDFPYDGRSSMINFSDVWERRQNSAALSNLIQRLSDARKAERRVWLVLDRHYLKAYTSEEMEKALRNRQPWAFTVRDVRAIYVALTARYGPTSTVYQTGGREPLHDDFVAYLFSPVPPRGNMQ